MIIALIDGVEIARTRQQHLMVFVNDSLKRCVFNFLKMDRL